MILLLLRNAALEGGPSPFADLVRIPVGALRIELAETRIRWFIALDPLAEAILELILGTLLNRTGKIWSRSRVAG
ncbi:MAG: hypothetical protein JWN95_4108 [Frankiales bacterium]|nr:hypothetical protein [Frankiales bacterium]